MLHFTKYLIPLSLVATLTIGCSSSDEDSTPAEAIHGTVAIGAPVVANITVTDANGNTLVTVSENNGSYSFTPNNMTAPFMLQATAQDGTVMYSVALPNEVVANITPLTTYILDQVAEALDIGGGPSALFSNFTQYTDNLSEQTIDQQMQMLDNYINSNFDHFNGEFVANHTDYDAFLDSMDIEMQGDDVIIRAGGTILDTLPYDIQDANITVTGRIYNAVTNQSVADANITFSNDEVSYSVLSDANGNFEVAVENYRNYDVTISAPGYNTVHYYNVSAFALSDIATSVIPLLDETISGSGEIAGSVINARTGEGLSGATVRLRDGINNRSGDVVATGTTDEQGAFDLQGVDTGVYTAEISRDGFTTTYVTVTSIGGDVVSVQAIPLVASATTSTNNEGAFATIVLTWGENPRDLDTHLTGPSTTALIEYPTSDRFHIAYYNKVITTTGSYPTSFDAENPCASPEVVASLDLDDTSSYGPETTTICKVEDGVYSYYVHHFGGYGSISDSPAEVTVTTANGISRHFIAPAGAPGNNGNDVWHVFNLDSNGNIIPVNTFSTDGTYGIRSIQTEDLFRYDNNLIDNLPAK